MALSASARRFASAPAEASPARDPCRDRLERLLGALAVGAAGLRQVGSAAATLAAEHFGADADQLDGIVGRGEIGGDADHQRRLCPPR